MAGIDRELAQAYSLLSMSDSGVGSTSAQNLTYQGAQAAPFAQASNLPCEVLPSGLSLPNDPQLALYGGMNSVSQVGHLPVTLYAGLQTPFNMASGNQPGLMNSSFSSGFATSGSDASSVSMGSACESSTSGFSSERSTQT